MLRRLVTAAAGLSLVFGGLGCGPKERTPPEPPPRRAEDVLDRFSALMIAGKNHLIQGEASEALTIYREAASLVPNDADVHLNLANAHLLAGATSEAVREAEEALRLDPNSAAAYFVKASAHLRAGRASEAIQALDNVLRIEPGEAATYFQLGRARMESKQWDLAVAAFKEGLSVAPNRLHTAAHYLLGQSLLRLGRTEEARQELEQHQAGLPTQTVSEGDMPFERCKYTLPRVPFRLDQPAADGVPVVFVDATASAFGSESNRYSGPVGIVDPEQTGWNDLFVMEGDRGFRRLSNAGGSFQTADPLLPTPPGTKFAALLVGDLQNDRLDDLLALGDRGSRLFSFGTNGVVTDHSETSQVASVRARAGALGDLDFTGKLDLVVVDAGTRDLRVFRQSAPLRFEEVTASAGIPAGSGDGHAVTLEDWNRDGTLDVLLARESGPVRVLEKQRGGKIVVRSPAVWPAGSVGCVADFDNDLHPDLVVVGDGKISVCFDGGTVREFACPGSRGLRRLMAFDHDNDGWLDLWGIGDSLKVWRNAGLRGFEDRTKALGLDRFVPGAVADVHAADFDRDCDADLVVELANGGLRYLRNDGGNAHAMVKVRLSGNRSNASGLGCKVEIESGGLRLTRTVHRWPIEIGVGNHPTLDSFLIHWFNWPQGSTGLPVDCQDPILAQEATIQEGSCPYLYAWDGTRFRFVTDILGAAPLGLPVAEGRFVDADPEELVWVGDEHTMVAREGRYRLAITEELREVLYLDQAKLVVVDREPGVEAHSTDKLLPGPPFPTGQLLTLHREHPLRRAEDLEGREVTPALLSIDGQRVSPPRLRVPQLRGLAEPHGLVLDFGPLNPADPLVLVLNGWLRFGGGMANVAASHDPGLPFPFPVLEAETSPGTWTPLDVVVGAPAGKTKTILVDLEGRLPPTCRRLRLSQAFEIHWDRIALLEKQPNPTTRIVALAPSEADLRFRGFGRLRTPSPDSPPSPEYDPAEPNSPWTVIPAGWSTRHGPVRELVLSRDEGLVLVHSGDELQLAFDAGALPAKTPGQVREFFLYVDGWDKDSDYHVATGTSIEPLPFHGMDSQRYGREDRPAFPSDELHRRYNTRWVDGSALRRVVRR